LCPCGEEGIATTDNKHTSFKKRWVWADKYGIILCKEFFFSGLICFVMDGVVTLMIADARWLF